MTASSLQSGRFCTILTASVNVSLWDLAHLGLSSKYSKDVHVVSSNLLARIQRKSSWHICLDFLDHVTLRVNVT